VKILRDSLANYVVDICDSVDVEDGDSPKHSERRTSFVEEDRLVYAFPVIRVNFVRLEQRDFDV
jgi:hypothetical protein